MFLGMITQKRGPIHSEFSRLVFQVALTESRDVCTHNEAV